MKRSVRFVSLLMVILMLLSVVRPFEVRAEESAVGTEAVTAEEMAAEPEKAEQTEIEAEPEDAAEEAEAAEKADADEATPADPEDAEIDPAEPEEALEEDSFDQEKAEDTAEPEKDAAKAKETPADPEMDEDEETPAKQEELSEKDVPSNPEEDAAEEEDTPADPEKTEEVPEKVEETPEKADPVKEEKEPAKEDPENTQTKKGVRGLTKSGDIIPLQLDTEVHVSGEVLSDRFEEAVILSFTPETDGKYYFYSYDYKVDPYAYLCDADHEILKQDDDGQGGDEDENRWNFGILADLTAGQTYYLYATVNSTGVIDYNVKVIIPNLFQLTLDAAGGYFDTQEQTTMMVEVREGTIKSYILPQPSHTEEGILFKGWARTPDSTETEDEFKDLQDGDTLYAVWEQGVRVTYHASEGYFDSYEEEGEIVYQKEVSYWYFIGSHPGGPQIYNDQGLAFMGWSLEEGSNEVIDSNYAVNEDVDLYAVWMDPHDFQPLTLGQQERVDISGKELWFRFTAEEDGCYVFRSEDRSSGDPRGELYDANMEQITGECDIYDNLNFWIFHDMQAGETCYLKTRDAFYGAASYAMAVYKAIHVTLDANGGYFDEEDQTTYSAQVIPGANWLVGMKTPQNVIGAKRFLGWTFTEGGTEADASWEDLTEGSILYAVWSSPGTLLLDTETPVSGEMIEDPFDDAVILAFTPEESGDYRFYSYAPSDDSQNPVIWLYSADMKELGYTDHGGEDMNFSLAVSLNRWETYYVYVSSCSRGVYDYKIKAEKVNGIHFTLDAKGGYFYPDETATIPVTVLPDMMSIYDLPIPANDAEELLFDGWSIEEDGSRPVTSFDGLTDGTNLYAIWTVGIRVEFHSTQGYFSRYEEEEGGELVEIKDSWGYVHAGEKADRYSFYATEVNNDLGLIFAGWSLSEDSDEIVDLKNYVITEETAFYAVWHSADTVPELARGQWTQTDVPAGSSVWFRFMAEEEGYYVFASKHEGNVDPYGIVYDANMDELTRDDDGFGYTDFRIQIYLEAGVSCYLRAFVNSGRGTSFKVIVDKAMEITLDANGGYYREEEGQVSTIQRQFFGAVDLLRCAPQPYSGEENKVFNGWATTADAEKPDVTEETVMTEGMTFYAVWGADLSDHYIYGDIYAAQYNYGVPYGGSAEWYFEYQSSYAGEENLSYQWYIYQAGEYSGYAEIPGATSPSQVFENITYRTGIMLRVTDADGFSEDFYGTAYVETSLWVDSMQSTRMCIEKGGSQTFTFETHINFGEYRTELQVFEYNKDMGEYIQVQTLENTDVYALNNIQKDCQIVYSAYDEYGNEDYYVISVHCGSHHIVTETGEPTCTSSVYYGQKYCEYCWEVFEEGTYMEPLGHDFGAWEVIREATADQPGLKQRVCRRDPDHVEQQEYSLDEHLLTVTLIKLNENGEVISKWDSASWVEGKKTVSSGETVTVRYACDAQYRVREMRWGSFENADKEIRFTEEDNDFYSIGNFTAGDEDVYVEIICRPINETEPRKVRVEMFTRLHDQTMISEEPGGTVSVDKYWAAPGEKIKVTAVPDEGFEVARVTYSGGETIGYSITSSMEFTMWKSKMDVTVYVWFQETHEWDDGVVVRQETDTAPGVKKYTCLTDPGYVEYRGYSTHGIDCFQIRGLNSKEVIPPIQGWAIYSLPNLLWNSSVNTYYGITWYQNDKLIEGETEPYLLISEPGAYQAKWFNREDLSGTQSSGSTAIICHIPGETVRENEVAATETTAGSYDEVVYCTACGEEISRTHKVVKITQPWTVTPASPKTLAVGKTASIKVTNAVDSPKLTYKSADTDIATVSTTGKITAKKVGTVKITVTAAETANCKNATKTITVKVTPAATSSITCTNLATGIKVAWKKVAGATGYYVYRGSKKIATIKSGSTITYTDKATKTNGTKYTYKVVPYAATGDGTSKTKTTYYLSRPAISKVTSTTAKKATVTWKKNAKTSGYQLRYSLKSDFKTGTKMVTVTSASTLKKVLSSLTSKKTYYVQLRSYKTVSGTKYYSAWSASKSIKIK